MAGRVILIAAAVIFFSGVSKPQELYIDSTPKFSYATIPEFWVQLDDIFNDPNFSNANWGVVIQSLETGEYFYKRNENKLFVPGSNLKLFTTAAGLSLLGPEYQFATDIFMNGSVDGSVLKGDLIIQGHGDPTISGRFHNGDMMAVLNSWADSLLEMGIDEISGNIIGDDNDFDEQGLGTGWGWDYESDWFSAPSSAVSFNDNCIDVSVFVQDKEPMIKIYPDTKYAIIINKVEAVPEDSVTSVKVYRERGTNVITIFGTIRMDSDTVKTYVTVNNPTQYAMVVFKELLEERGITVGGYPIDIDDAAVPVDYTFATRLLTHYSPPLKDIVKVINKSSQNFFAEQLMKTIGLELAGYGSIENGVEASTDIFQEMGINTENFVMVDGSGLSRLNLVTPKQLVSILQYMYKSRNFIPFYNSLPIAGVDGTLGKRMKNSKAENNVRAKTGYVGAVRSLSGYAFTGDNEPVAFSIIANNFNVPVKLADNIQDLVCLRLANFKRK